MAFFAVPHVIHFDDTMAYGSHHFLSNFKLQCAGREHLLFSPRLYDRPELRRAFDEVALLTYEAYSRNLAPAHLGERLLVLVSFEEWTEIGFRFCFRVLKRDGTPVSCGYQTILCASRATSEVVPFPAAFRDCFQELTDIEEASAPHSFRERVHRGGKAVREIFSDEVRALVSASLPAGGDLPGPSMIGCKPAVAVVQEKPALALPPGATAFVFPGQGSLDLAALLELVRALPELHGELRAAAEIWRQRIGQGCEALLFAPTPAAAQTLLAAAPDLDQLGIFLTGVLGARLLEKRGTSAAVMVGHSFGEIAALTAAGALDLRTGAEVVCQRLLALRLVGPQAGTLAAVSLTESEARAALAAAGLAETVLGGVNHARQTVVSGPRAELERLGEHLRAQGKSLTPIASAYPFHHPRLQPAAEAFAAALSGLAIGAPAVPVYSPIGHALYTGAPGEIVRELASHLVRPFDFPRAIAALHEAGCRRYVECCAQERLGRIIKKLVPAGAEVAIESLAPALAAGRAAPLTAHEPGPAPVAIVALGCVLPGGARDPDAFWENLRRGVSGIIDQREGRAPEAVAEIFDPAGAPDKTYSLLAGAVRAEDLVAPAGVDAARFADWTRAQKELGVALAQAVKGTTALDGKRVECLVGATGDGCEEYDRVLALERLDGILQAAGERPLGAGGPGSAALAPFGSLREVVQQIAGANARLLLLDAACASSLYTLALGCQRLQDGDADLVFAGGVFAAGPGNSCLFAQFRGLSATGSRPFDRSADGVVFGDGAALVALKRLDDALRDGDDIRAVVRAVGLSSDGKSSSANVPRSEGQLLAMERCYQSGAISPASVQYLEAHGTATPAGDATELKSIARCYGDRSASPLRLGSLKALTGHTGWAAGAASIIKICQALRHQTLPRQHNFEQPQDELAALGQGYRVDTSEQPWPANGSEPRRAAANGFGFGGTNAHVVLEEYLPARHAPMPRRPARAAQERQLAVVACESLLDGGLANVALPKSLRLLPDIAEDMDATQRLGLVLTERIARGLGEAFQKLKAGTAVVLALEGKTARGREAGLRVLAGSLLRELLPPGGERTARARELVKAACRPSGPYTLQGMMPNVTPGRIANVFDLKGPNFLVDGGERSLCDVLDTARMLLDGGSALVLAGVFEGAEEQEPRAAALVGLCTPELAARAGLPVLCTLAIPQAAAGPRSAAELVRAIDLARTSSGRATFDAVPEDAVAHYQPALVPRPLPSGARDDWSQRRVLFLAADLKLAEELEREAGPRCADFRVLLAAGCANGGKPRAATFIELTEDAARSQLAFLDQWAPERVVSVARLESAAAEAQVVRDATSSRGLLELQFLVTRKLYGRLAQGETIFASACLAALTPEGALHPATGLFAGFAKSVGREVGASRVRVVALAEASLAAGLDAVARELAHPALVPTEAVWAAGERSVRLLTRSTGPGQRPVSLDRDSVVLATGGARGVTAVLVEALLQQFGCTVVVVGRSELSGAPAEVLGAREEDLDALEQQFYAAELQRDPSARIAELRQRFDRSRAVNELRRNLDRFAKLGGTVAYRCADVTRAEQVEAVVDEVRRTFGRLDLVLHGAGLQSSKKLEKRKLAELRQNLDVKLLGLHHLYAACARCFAGPVAFHLLSSAFSFYGNDGQPDYGAANETLDRLCAFVSARRGQASWSSIGWLAWDGIGMTNASEYRTLRSARKLHRLSAEEGQRLFLRVLKGPRPVNVQLTDDERAFYSIEVAAAPTPSAPSTQALQIEADSAWLSDHLVRGDPTLPGAWALDLMLGAALREAKDKGPVRIEGGRFSRFLRMKRGTSHTLRAQVVHAGGGAQVRLVGDIVHKSGLVLDKDVLYAEASFVFGGPAESAAAVCLPGEGSVQARDPYCSAGADVELRGRFDVLRDICLGADSRSAEVLLPADAGESGRHLPAILLDAAWRLGAIHAEGPGRTVYAALDFERIWISPRAAELAGERVRLSLRATRPQLDGATVRCERVEVTDQRGAVVLYVEGGRGRRLN